MQGLNNHDKMGKGEWEATPSLHAMLTAIVLYLGVSDTPAWIISKVNQYARDHGLAPFVCHATRYGHLWADRRQGFYQGRWSAVVRDLERGLLPMCREEGMAIAPWGAIGQG